MDCDNWKPFVGQTINGQYELKELLGCGAFGGVFLSGEMLAGRHISEVAVKLITPAGSKLDDQLRELIAMRNLNHPGIARGLNVGQCCLNSVNLLYLVMDLAEGTLQNRLATSDLTVKEIIEITRDVCEGLAYLHARNIVHRDLKPANILRILGRWQLSDLGLVRDVGAYTAQQTQALAGTPNYMPPEALDGQIAPAGDMWSLGVMLVETLTGNLPFQGTTFQHLFNAILNSDPVITSPLPKPFDIIVSNLLVKDRKARWTAKQTLDWLTISINDHAQEAITFARSALPIDNAPRPNESRNPQTSVMGSASPTPKQNPAALLTDQVLNLESAASAASPRRRLTRKILLFAVLALVITGISLALFKPKIFQGGGSQSQALKNSKLSEPAKPFDRIDASFMVIGMYMGQCVARGGQVGRSAEFKIAQHLELTGVEDSKRRAVIELLRKCAEGASLSNDERGANLGEAAQIIADAAVSYNSTYGNSCFGIGLRLGEAFSMLNKFANQKGDFDPVKLVQMYVAPSLSYVKQVQSEIPFPERMRNPLNRLALMVVEKPENCNQAMQEIALLSYWVWKLAENNEGAGVRTIDPSKDAEYSNGMMGRLEREGFFAN